MHGDAYRWDDLRVFLAVLRAGSFSAAAQQLGVEQSTVSRRVAALERSVGGPLFDRRSTGPVATALGGTLAPLAEQVERQARAVLEAAAATGHAVEGRVRLAVTESFAVQVVIPFVLRGLLDKHPGLQLDLVVDDRAADLAHREADLAIRHFRPPVGDLVIRQLANFERGYVASADYAETAAGRAPEDLTWLVQHLPGGSYGDEAFIDAHVGCAARVRTTGHLALIAAARAGLGVAMLTDAQRALDPALVPMALPMPAPAPVGVWLVAPLSLRAVPRVAAVWSHLELELPGALAPLGTGRNNDDD